LRTKARPGLGTGDQFLQPDIIWQPLHTPRPEAVAAREEGGELVAGAGVEQDGLGPALAGAEHVAIGEAAAGGQAAEVRQGHAPLMMSLMCTSWARSRRASKAAAISIWPLTPCSRSTATRGRECELASQPGIAKACITAWVSDWRTCSTAPASSLNSTLKMRREFGLAQAFRLGPASSSTSSANTVETQLVDIEVHPAMAGKGHLADGGEQAAVGTVVIGEQLARGASAWTVSKKAPSAAGEGASGQRSPTCLYTWAKLEAPRRFAAERRGRSGSASVVAGVAAQLRRQHVRARRSPARRRR
jgi:hypothetical protein